MNDDLIKAALIDDEEDLREKEEKSTVEEPSEEADAQEEQAPEEVETEEPEEAEEEPEEKVEQKAEAEPEAAKPESESPEEHKPTRKERREERRQAWLDQVRREQEQTESQRQQQDDPLKDYKPLDYSQQESYNEDELKQDRTNYGELNRRQGSEETRFIAEQDKFWTTVSYDAKLLAYDPKYKFLDENDENAFDPDLAADLNEKYLAFVGFDPNSKTVRRTDISYERFVKKEMAEREAWAERLAADEKRTVEETKATTSVRPGGTRKSGLGKLKPGDISKMSDAEFAKYEAEIDKQIEAELGIK